MLAAAVAVAALAGTAIAGVAASDRDDKDADALADEPVPVIEPVTSGIPSGGANSSTAGEGPGAVQSRESDGSVPEAGTAVDPVEDEGVVSSGAREAVGEILGSELTLPSPSPPLVDVEVGIDDSPIAVTVPGLLRIPTVVSGTVELDDGDVRLDVAVPLG